jgi:hypothetical protein
MTARPQLPAGREGVRCRLCGRRRDSHRVNDRAGYRCPHVQQLPDPPARHSRNVYVHEDVLLPRLVRQLVPDRVDPESTLSRARGGGRCSSAGCTGRSAPRCRVRRHDDSRRSAGRPCRGGVLLRRERVTQDGRANRPAWRSTHPVDCGRDRRRHADGRVGSPDFDGGCGCSLQLGLVDVDLDSPDPDDR